MNGESQKEISANQVSMTTNDEDGEKEEASMSMDYPELERNVLPSSENSYSSILLDMNTLEEGNTIKGQSETQDMSTTGVEDSQITINLNETNKTDNDETITIEHDNNSVNPNATLEFPNQEKSLDKDTDGSINSELENENVTSTTQIGNDGEIQQPINSDKNTDTQQNEGANEVTSTNGSINPEPIDVQNTRRLGIHGPQKKLMLKIKLEKFDNDLQAQVDHNSSIQISTDGENEQPKVTLYCCNKCPKRFYMTTGYETHLFQNHGIRNVEEYPATVMYKQLDSPSSRSLGKDNTESRDNTCSEDRNKSQNNDDEEQSGELFTAFDGNEGEEITNENVEEGQVAGEGNPDLDQPDSDEMNKKKQTRNGKYVWKFISESWSENIHRSKDSAQRE